MDYPFFLSFHLQFPVTNVCPPHVSGRKNCNIVTFSRRGDFKQRTRGALRDFENSIVILHLVTPILTLKDFNLSFPQHILCGLRMSCFANSANHSIHCPLKPTHTLFLKLNERDISAQISTL